MMDLPPSHLVLANVTTVAGAMKKNSRWAHASSYTGGGGPNAGRRRQQQQQQRLRGVNGEVGGRGGDNGRDGGGGGGTNSSVQEGEEELMGGFVELRWKVVESEELPPLASLVAPFLSLIRSPLTTGPITSHALTAILSLLTLFPPASAANSPQDEDLTKALSDISWAVTHCKFEASDSQGDEVVLLKILGVIGKVVEGWGGSAEEKGVALGDKEVCEMLETGLGMCCQMRLSELLRRTAETTVQSMVRVVFSHLKTLDPSSVPPPSSLLVPAPVESTSSTTAVAPSDQSSPSTNTILESEGIAPIAPMDPTALPLAAFEPKTPTNEVPPVLDSNEVLPTSGPSSPLPLPPPPTIFAPYGSPTTTELIRVLITLLNPSDQQHTDSMRLAALGILNVALEVSGSHIGKWEEMRSMLSDEGCKYLFQLTRSDSSNLLSSSLRTTSTLFATMRVHLKPQLELFLSYLIDRLSPPPSALHPSHGVGGSSASSVAGGGGAASEKEEQQGGKGGSGSALGLTAHGETRDLLLEALAHLARYPSFLVDLWVNYDCDMDREDLFEKTVGFLTRGVYPNSPGVGGGSEIQTDAQAISLHILLSSINTMAERVESGGLPWPESYPPPTSFPATKDRKRILLAGAVRFNTKPKLGLAFLESNGLLTNVPGPERSKAIASLLKSTPKLDKTMLGDYLGRPENVEVLRAFIGLFDFKDKLVADAMRDLLEAFRLPGESQQISRVTETFAEIYFASGPAEIQSADAVYVLAFSIIMLNTDLFSPQVRKRMTFEDYKKNLRGVNLNADFSDTFLMDIYESIKKREIILPAEHQGQLGFDYAWKELLARAPAAGPMLVCDSPLFDRDMFNVVSKQVISSIAYAFTTFNDDYVIQRAITGFRQCATLAGKFHLPEVFDHIVMALSQTTGLLDDRDPSQSSLNNPVVEVEGQSLTVSGLSVRFGLNFKAQLAAVVLFTIANGNGNSIREGWSQIFEMYQTLFLHSLLPTPMLQMEDFLGGTSMIPLQVAPPASARDDRRSDVGLLSTLSSYLLSPYGSSADTLGVPTCTDDEVEATLSTVDCLGSCRFEELYGQVVDLELDSLLSAIRAIKDLADRRASPKKDAPRDPRRRPEGSKSGRDSPAPSLRDGQVAYDPASVFLLEMLISLTSQSKVNISETWPIVFEHLSLLISSANVYSILLIERAVVGLLRLCLVISTESSLRDQLYVALDLLRSLPGPILNSVSEQLMAGVAKILEQDSSLIKSPTEWGLVLALVRGSISHPEASKVALSLVEKILGGQSGPGVTADNFAGLVSILSDFAGFGGVSAAGRQQRGRRPTGSGVTEPAVERALRAIDALFNLKEPAAALVAASSLHPVEASKLFWLPPLKSLGTQVVNPSREIRQRALGYLQRTLPGNQQLPTSTLSIAFEFVLFPTLDELLKPQVFMLDPQGMEETRLRAQALLCRVFLVYLSEKGEEEDITELWLGVIDVLDRLMNSGKPDQLYEAVPESLKNLLLVLHSSSILLPPVSPDPRTESQKAFWTTTYERIERFLPTFLEGLFPPSPPVVQEKLVAVEEEKKEAEVPVLGEKVELA
ncbi:hypothetical protein BDY24DRAFT_386920 [Mrakia frigida]|uniref:uncharacterized protein n=1 Tax=Mrakia frigida TaxID=29902 RepID=UPI003FCC02C2